MQTTLKVLYNHETNKYMVKNDETSKIKIEFEFENFIDLKEFIETTLKLNNIIRRASEQNKSAE